MQALHRFVGWAVGVALASAGSTALAQAATGAPAMSRDEAVAAAAEAFRVRNMTRLAQLAPAARGHILEPYVDYWQLMLRLDEAPPEVVQGFLTRHRATYVADRLRAEWIRQLGRRLDWQRIAAEGGAVLPDDTDSNCWLMQARWRLGDPLQVALARPLFDLPRGIPEGCQPMIDQLVATGQIKERQIWERARVLFDNGQLTAAARALDALPAQDRIERATLDAISASPQRFLEKSKPDVSRRAGREAALLALSRWARSEPTEAIAFLERGSLGKIAADDAAYVYAQAALTASRRHMPEALAWYARADAVTLTDEQLAWRVRAALRQVRWREVRAAIDKMPTTQKNDPTWVYWLGRAERELGRAEEANTLFTRIAGQPSFYGKLAAEELGQTIAPPPVGHVPTADEVQAASREPGLLRALALFRLEQRMDAIREWNFSIRGWDDKQLLAAAEFARRNEVWDRAINTAERTAALHDFNLRFLAPYRPLFAEFAKRENIEESWVLGLVRQESRFNPSVKSSAGATGLMQLMPGTARMVAKRIGMKDFRWSEVTDPEINIRLGTSYMREVLDGLDGHPLLASAAYNAGPGRAQRWRADRPLEGAIYAETIPFNETRDYVKKVFSNTMYYAALGGSTESRTLKARLGTIAPRAQGNVRAE